VIERAILLRLRHGVCAIGYLRQPLENARPWFKVVGTGFLVRKETVITNRHVLDALDSEMKSEGIPALGSMTPALSAVRRTDPVFDPVVLSRKTSWARFGYQGRTPSLSTRRRSGHRALAMSKSRRRTT